MEGWYLDGNPRNDLCPECNRKPIKSALDTSKKAVADMMAPMVGTEHKVHFSELKAIAATLDPQQAKELILVLRERIPKRPRVEKPAEPEPQSDVDYEQWLRELE